MRSRSSALIREERRHCAGCFHSGLELDDSPQFRNEAGMPSMMFADVFNGLQIAIQILLCEDKSLI